ncbi:MAG TPA: wax ester/triacylglycerol synthase family O-acyltransferase [Candidatus Elarobacter sp.]|jgi:WS/DGAT/MGAT family acyltransferase|nr:wax ester/triacylglycerol synthase family O-acyltransferase [Candidatus Elarobacter sp.]
MSAAIRKLSVVDSAFLFGETAECPMHVGSLTIVKLPDDYDGDFYEDFKARIASRIGLAKSLRWKLAQAPFDIDRPSWVDDPDFDLDRHVLRGALPEPHDRHTAERIAGWLHARALNRARPLWEIYVFDGMPNGEAAIYSKMHHALIDGGAGAALTEIIYETSPHRVAVETHAEDTRERAAPQQQDVRDIASSMFAAYAELWRAPLEPSGLRDLQLPRSGGSDLASVLLDAAIHQAEWPLRLAANASEIAKAYASAVTNALSPDALKALRLLSAPSTPLNAAISSERSFAGVTVPMARVKAVAAKAGGKVNDVVLALSSGVLRRYLAGRDALPAKSLTAFVPISAREKGDAELKNQVFGMVVPLATDVDDPKARLDAIVAGAATSKELANPFRALVPHFAEIPTFGTPMLLQLLAVFYGRSRLADSVPPPVNVVVSNIVFSRTPIFIAGARIEHVFPMSIPVHGQALNITVNGYVDGLDFGLIAGANVVPDVEAIAELLPAELEALERAVGTAA